MAMKTIVQSSMPGVPKTASSARPLMPTAAMVPTE